jgi:hypothetical protein
MKRGISISVQGVLIYIIFVRNSEYVIESKYVIKACYCL